MISCEPAAAAAAVAAAESPPECVGNHVQVQRAKPILEYSTARLTASQSARLRGAVRVCARRHAQHAAARVRPVPTRWAAAAEQHHCGPGRSPSTGWLCLAAAGRGACGLPCSGRRRRTDWWAGRMRECTCSTRSTAPRAVRAKRPAPERLLLCRHLPKLSHTGDVLCVSTMVGSQSLGQGRHSTPTHCRPPGKSRL